MVLRRNASGAGLAAPKRYTRSKIATGRNAKTTTKPETKRVGRELQGGETQSMTFRSRAIRLRSRPEGSAGPEHFELVETTGAGPADGEVLVRNIWMSVDPYMRGRMNAGRSYVAPFELGAPLEGSAMGVVEVSNTPGLAPGDVVRHFHGWREHAVLPASQAEKIQTNGLPMQAWLGPLGVPGLTAYVGLVRIGRVRSGETVFVSAAAGAVGSIACQIARNLGCRVVGSAGSEEKLEWLRHEVGVDAALNYRSPAFAAELASVCPQGIDVYFDNVGGLQLEAALTLANDNARFPLCGMISGYEGTTPPGPSNLFVAITRRITLQGFLVIDHSDLAPEFEARMRAWIDEDKVTWRETIVEGLEAAPAAFLSLFRGANTGKMLVRLSE
jgi:NADPH-dependent curcumin reductase CurA